jgi:hypothetical protein
MLAQICVVLVQSLRYLALFFINFVTNLILNLEKYMNNQTPDKSRRSILKGLIGIPVVAIAGYQSIAHAAMLSEDDPTAQALGYQAESTVDGKTCSNCGIYQGGSAASGACPIFPGKDVAAAGYCKSWVAKA